MRDLNLSASVCCHAVALAFPARVILPSSVSNRAVRVTSSLKLLGQYRMCHDSVSHDSMLQRGPFCASSLLCRVDAILRNRDCSDSSMQIRALCGQWVRNTS